MVNTVQMNIASRTVGTSRTGSFIGIFPIFLSGRMMKTKMASGGNGGKPEISTRSEDVQM